MWRFYIVRSVFYVSTSSLILVLNLLILTFGLYVVFDLKNQ